MSGEIDRIELLNAMAGMAEASWKLFSDLKNEGFTEDQALRLTMAWFRGIVAARDEE